MVKLTQIQVTEDTRKSLQKLRLTSRESYNEIIIRLVKIKTDIDLQEIRAKAIRLCSTRVKLPNA